MCKCTEYEHVRTCARVYWWLVTFSVAYHVRCAFFEGVRHVCVCVLCVCVRVCVCSVWVCFVCAYVGVCAHVFERERRAARESN